VSDPSRDRELEALFQGLREEQEGRTPDFTTMMAEVHRAIAAGGAEGPARRLPRRWRRPTRPQAAWASGALAAAAAAAVLLVGPGRQEDRFVAAVRAFEAQSAAGAWRSPTDDLLKVPGLELVTSLPNIGGPPVPNQPAGSRPRSQL
jgi:hypothetical protein